MEDMRRVMLGLARQRVLPLAIAVLVPMIGAGITRLPLRDPLNFAHRLLL
jgi:hypothetical protein